MFLLMLHRPISIYLTKLSHISETMTKKQGTAELRIKDVDDGEEQK